MDRNNLSIVSITNCKVLPDITESIDFDLIIGHTELYVTNATNDELLILSLMGVNILKQFSRSDAAILRNLTIGCSYDSE